MEILSAIFFSVFLYLFIMAFYNWVFTENSNALEKSNNLYAKFNKKIWKKKYQDDKNFKVKLLKIDDFKSCSCSCFLLISKT